MNPAQDGIGAAVAAFGAKLNGGTLVGYDGTMPATPETALSGNTAHVTLTYSATAFGTPAYAGGFMSAAASFTGSANPASNGGITFFRAYKSDGVTAEGDFTCGSAWIASNVTAVGQYCTNGGNTYKCTVAGTTASSGGPTGTTAGITDGTVTWDYVGTVSDTWAASTVYAAKAAVIKGGNWYVCTIGGTSAASGGPSGTGTDIVDGTAHWDYLAPATLFDVTMGNCNVQVGVSVTVTQTLKMPAV